MGIVKHDEILKLRKAGGHTGALKKRWAGHGDNALIHQQFAVQARADFRLAVAHCDIHAIGAEVRQPVRGQHTQIDIRVFLRKVASLGISHFEANVGVTLTVK